MQPLTMEMTFTLDKLSEAAKAILEKSTSRTLLFYGEMGVGKTTLIKEIAKKLGSKDSLTSPTFSLVNEHLLDKGRLYHFDFYRIDNETEALDMGFEDYLSSGDWVMIEWPEKVTSLLPEEHTTIRLQKNENGTRTLKMNAYAIV